MHELLKIGFTVAYDWKYLETSLPLVYDYADKICLSVDEANISWAGTPYLFNNDEFIQFIQQIDTQKKIIIYRDNFHLSELSPMQNEVRQRNLMAENLGKGGWHMQLDADEYVLEMGNIKTFLTKNKKLFLGKDINICLPLLILFKKNKKSLHLINSSSEWCPIITNNPHYEHGRRNGYFNYKLNKLVLHQSWARSEEEILQKIKNWGHKNDFDTNKFYQNWKNLDDTNYQEWNNFHPIEPKIWKNLIKIEGTIHDLMNNKKIIHEINKQNTFILKLNNSRIFSKLKQLIKF